MSELHNLLGVAYNQVLSCNLLGDLEGITSRCAQLEKQLDLASDPAEQKTLYRYLWCFQTFMAQLLVRQELYGQVIGLCRRMLAQRDSVVFSSPAGEDHRSLDLLVDGYVLYMLGMAKWIGSDRLREAVLSPREMLETWCGLLDRADELGLAGSEHTELQLRLSGQAVLQTGLRYCPLDSAEAMLRFNHRFDTCINRVPRHYRTCPFPPKDCYLYWSMELAKAMYSGDLGVDELRFLQLSERRAMYSRDERFVNQEYGDVAYESFSEIIARKFCPDYPGHFSLYLPSRN